MASGNLKHYLGRGPAADRPATLDLAPGLFGLWLSMDTGQLDIWNGSGWSAFSGSLPDAITTPTGSSGTLTLDMAGGVNKNFRLNPLTGNATLAVSNLAAAGRITEFECLITQDASGGRTLALPAAFRPLGGSDTSIAAAAGAKTVLSAKTMDAGTTWLYAMQEVG